MQGESVESTAASMAKCLSETGCLIVRDPRVGQSDNETFLNLMESYFEQPEAVKLKDARPALHYQVPYLCRYISFSLRTRIRYPSTSKAQAGQEVLSQCWTPGSQAR